jgi:prepilin-type processing-associated H-X9-DG protein
MCGGDSPFSFGTFTTKGGNTNYKNIQWMRGCFGYRTAHTLESITDGTSNTILFSERATSNRQDGVLRIIEAAISNFNINSAWNGLNQNASAHHRVDCINTRNGQDYKTPITGVTNPTGYKGHLGWNYTDGHYLHSTFYTAISPNGPSCYYRTNRDLGIITPTSNHSGGVVVGFADGSVRFINEAIDIGTGDSANRDSGSPSVYGVWGALGSRCGGESVTAP